MLVCDDRSTVHIQLLAPRSCCHLLRVGALFEGFESFASYFDLFLCHFAGFHVANRSVTLLLILHRCVKSFSAFFVANAVNTPIDGVGMSQSVVTTRNVYSGGSAVRAQPRLLRRLLDTTVIQC